MNQYNQANWSMLVFLYKYPTFSYFLKRNWWFLLIASGHAIAEGPFAIFGIALTILVMYLYWYFRYGKDFYDNKKTLSENELKK